MKSDRRKIIIYLTEEGKMLQEKYIEVSKEMTNLFYYEFKESEIKDFEKHLERIEINLMENS
ncbi:MAG: hypothetical protein ACTSP3_02620 [Candidatus Heimdallarchaeaceae archaeon]